MSSLDRQTSAIPPAHLAIDSRSLRWLESLIVLSIIGLGTAMFKMAGHRLVLLHLFTLPITLAAFYLGRYRAGALALFSMLTASVVAGSTLPNSVVPLSPVIIGLSIVVWAAVLGLNAMLAGTLSDERHRAIHDLETTRSAIVSAVLQQLLKASPEHRNRSYRIAGICTLVGQARKLPPNVVNDIWIAVLLFELDQLEIQSSASRHAGKLGPNPTAGGLDAHRFSGSVLVDALIRSLPGTASLVNAQRQESALGTDPVDSPDPGIREAQAIIRCIRAIEQLTHDSRLSSIEASFLLGQDQQGRYDSRLLTMCVDAIHDYDQRTNELEIHEPFPFAPVANAGERATVADSD